MDARPRSLGPPAACARHLHRPRAVPRRSAGASPVGRDVRAEQTNLVTVRRGLHNPHDLVNVPGGAGGAVLLDQLVETTELHEGDCRRSVLGNRRRGEQVRAQTRSTGSRRRRRGSAASESRAPPSERALEVARARHRDLWPSPGRPLEAIQRSGLRSGSLRLMRRPQWPRRCSQLDPRACTPGASRPRGTCRTSRCARPLTCAAPRLCRRL